MGSGVDGGFAYGCLWTDSTAGLYSYLLHTDRSLTAMTSRWMTFTYAVFCRILISHTTIPSVSIFQGCPKIRVTKLKDVKYMYVKKAIVFVRRLYRTLSHIPCNAWLIWTLIIHHQNWQLLCEKPGTISIILSAYLKWFTSTLNASMNSVFNAVTSSADKSFQGNYLIHTRDDRPLSLLQWFVVHTNQRIDISYIGSNWTNIKWKNIAIVFCLKDVKYVYRCSLKRVK